MLPYIAYMDPMGNSLEQPRMEIQILDDSGVLHHRVKRIETAATLWAARPKLVSFISIYNWFTD